MPTGEYTCAVKSGVQLRRAIVSAAFAALLLLTQPVHAEDVKLRLLDSNTGHPLHRKAVCVSFTPAINATGVDKPNVCGKTDASGKFTVTLPATQPTYLHVSVLTNDLIPCFAIPHAIPVSDILDTGVVIADTRGPERIKPRPERGMIVAFAHQLTFGEVLKSMWNEL